MLYTNENHIGKNLIFQLQLALYILIVILLLWAYSKLMLVEDGTTGCELINLESISSLLFMQLNQ